MASPETDDRSYPRARSTTRRFKAGMGEFNVKKLLDSYLGDVQVVTEFKPVRERIVRRFHETMRQAAEVSPDARLCVVAHSEGTVISFLGLLQACHEPARHPWIDRVDWFITLGSPIDKHLILWPELFAPYERDPSQPAARSDGPARIRWVNYADRADPVGFKLETAQNWILANGYGSVFNFAPTDDFVYRRYAVPGKAHVDYWTDRELFTNLVNELVEGRNPQGPRSRAGIVWLSKMIGYVIPVGLVLAASYVFCHGAAGYLEPGGSASSYLNRTIVGLALLVTGTTGWVRLARLTSHLFWWAMGLVLYLAGAGLFVATMWGVRGQAAPVLDWLGTFGAQLGVGRIYTCLGLSALFLVTFFVRDLGRVRGVRNVPQIYRRTKDRAARILPSAAKALTHLRDGRWGGAWRGTSGWMSRAGDARRQLMPTDKWMMIAVGLVLLELLVFSSIKAEWPPWSSHLVQRGPLWSMLLAGAAALYLWRLAIVVFDLLFTWQRYIEGDAGLDALRRTASEIPRIRVKPANPSTGEGNR